MFSQWLAAMFPPVRVDDDMIDVVVNSPMIERDHKITAVVIDPEVEVEATVYIEKMTDLLQELNERLAECPKGVVVLLELTTYKHPYITNTAPKVKYRLEGTVGKKL